MTNNAIRRAHKNGMTATLNFSILMFPMLHPTNRFTPTGGVKNPIEEQVIMIIPKWIGWMPNLVTMGKSSGVKIKILARASINVPIISRNIRMMGIRTILLSEIASSKSTSMSGTL